MDRRLQLASVALFAAASAPMLAQTPTPAAGVTALRARVPGPVVAVRLRP